MSMFENMMSAFGGMESMMGGLGGGQSPISANSFSGQDEMAKALMDMNSPGPNTMQPGGGMMPGMTPGSPSYGGMNAPTSPSMEKDEMQMLQPGPSDDGGGSIAGNMAQLFMMFSDRRLKDNIRLVGNINGTNLYSYNYIWDDVERIGVMADEVPHAAVRHPSGFMMVDYSKVL
jgi:hypothetical protein